MQSDRHLLQLLLLLLELIVIKAELLASLHVGDLSHGGISMLIG